MSRYIKLPSNQQVLDADRIQVIVRQDLGQYAIVMHECPVTLKATTEDVEALEYFLNVTPIESPKPAVVVS